MSDSRKRIPCDFGERLFAIMDPLYRCGIYCLLEFSGRLELERLTNAFLAALAEEPMWSHRFVDAYWRPYWEPIPRAQRRELVQMIDAEADPGGLGRILRGGIDAAVRLHLVRGPADDALCIQLDHRLADTTAARLLIASLAAHYAAEDVEPAEDAPLVRRTTLLFRSVVDRHQRRKNLAEAAKSQAAMRKTPVPYPIPLPDADDPVDLPPVLQFPHGTLDALRIRAMQDRGTPTLAILAATYLGVRDILGMAPDSTLHLGIPIDLRRYLPPEQQPAPASMLLGRAFVPVREPGADSMSAVMAQLRAGMAKERGSQFGLVLSPVSLDVPIVRAFAALMPFKLLQTRFHTKNRRQPPRPDVQVSDQGELGRPGERWGDAALRNAYTTPGLWAIPGSVSVCSGTCGSRINITVATNPRSFAQKLAAAMQRRLCDYMGVPVPPADAEHEAREAPHRDHAAPPRERTVLKPTRA